MKEKYSKNKMFKNTETHTYNSETGEVLSQSKISTYSIEKEPDYVNLYLHDICKVYGLEPAHSKVLTALLRFMNYQNMIVLLKPIKEMIAMELNISLNTLERAIVVLAKENILIRTHQSIYVVDPNLFGKGKWEDIKEIRLSITYSANGKKQIQSNITRAKQLSIFSAIE